MPRPFDDTGVTATTAGGNNSDIGAFEHLPYVNNNAGNALANSGAGSLRDTFAEVPAGTFVIFDPDFFGNSLTTGIARTISLSGGQILLNKNTSIVGTTANALTIRNTAAPSTTSRVFQISGGFTVELSGMTITGGNPMSAAAAGFSTPAHPDAALCPRHGQHHQRFWRRDSQQRRHSEHLPQHRQQQHR